MALTRPLLDQINTNKAELSDNLIRINSSSDTADKDVGFILNRDGGISENIAITWKEESNVIVFGYTTSTGEQAEEVVEFTGNIGIDVGSVVINGVSIEVDPVTKKLTVDGVEISDGGGGTANIYQLPSITDFPAEGTEDSLYIAKDTGILYRWDESISNYVATGFEDAPSDGKQYVRKDGEWVEDLSSGIRLPDAHGFLDPSIIAAIQSTYTDYVYLVDIGGDIRFDQSVPPELSGDQSGNIIKWETGVGWQSVGRFTGEQGPEGIGLRILGSLPNVPSLPTDGNEAGDSFIIQENMYVWDGTSWKKLSQVGPPGKSAYEIAIQTGSITSNVSQAAWIASLKGKDAYDTAIEVGAIPPSASKSDFIEYLRGEDGQSAYQIAVSEGGFVGTIFQWLESLRGDVGPEGPQGPQGIQGPMGAGIHILGKLNDESELPPSSDIGSGYMIGTDFHVWDGDEWQNVGPIQGPEGPQGPQGVAGEKGDPGLSAYDLAALTGEIDPGEVSVTEWIRSLKGNTGQSAYEAAIEENIISSEVSRSEWLLSLQGTDGGNAYVVAVENGFSGNVEQWLESIRGPQGIQGFTGNTGANAYVVATQNGFVGSVEDWLESLVGATGEVGASAYEVAVDNGFVGSEEDWLASLKGIDGKSAYEVAVDDGFVGSESAWLESLKGIDGIDGKSAYEVAVDNGFVGTEGDWLASLNGIDGKSAYEVAVDNGFVGSEEDWLASLRGLKGDAGASLILSGRVATVGELPVIAEENDAYVVGEDLYVYIDGNWENLGRIAGESAYEVAVHSGFTGNVEEWLESLVGPQGVQGIQGDKGDTGTGLVLKGTVPSIGDLPSDAAEGDAYTIDGNIYTNVDSNWVDGGRIIGLSAYEIAVDDGFSGSITDWLNSLIGPQGIQGETGANAYVIALDNGFVGSEVEWLDSLVGEAGANAYVIALDNGFVGSEVEWLDSLVGEAGADGADGANAYVIALDNGFVGSEVEWLDSLEGQNAYQLAVSKGFEGSVEDWLNSLEGDSAYQIAVANGFVGTVEDWLASIKGDVGNAFIISGNVSSVGDLPAPSYDGLSYFVNKNLYTVVNGSWEFVANLEGPQGKSAYEETKETYPSEVQSFEDFIEFIRGNTGNSVVMKGTLDSAADLANIVDPEVGHVYATEYQLYFWDGTNWISSGSLRGAQGPQGIQGPMGAGIHILGKLNDESELPPSSDVGSGYMIGTDFHVWDGDEWQNVGPIQGPEGPQGPQGPQGIQGPIGPTGPQGPRGSRWIALDGIPSPATGEQFDYYINRLTNEYFYKTTLTNWVSMGYLGGGNVYKPVFDGNPKVMIDGEWENLDDGLALSKFKTINGESILGTGNIVINAIDVETLVWQGI